MEQVRRAYSQVADQYRALFGSTAYMPADDLALIGRHLSIRPGTVLDVGCGPGYLTDYLCSLGVDATGIDLVPEFIDHARATYPNGRYELGSMHDLPTPDQSLAGILAWYSLIHLPPESLDEVLAELRRVMVPGGTLVVGFFDGDEVEAFEHKVVTAFYWPADELAARLFKAGFSEIERLVRPGEDKYGRRPHGSIAAMLH
jgi:SAM-dependent methyltransferase